MILTDRIKSLAGTGQPPENALQKVRDFYEDPDGILIGAAWVSGETRGEAIGNLVASGTVIQYWAVNDTHFFVVMIDGRCDCLRVFKGTSHGLEDAKWNLSVDSQTKFIEDDPI